MKKILFNKSILTLVFAAQFLVGAQLFSTTAFSATMQCHNLFTDANRAVKPVHGGLLSRIGGADRISMRAITKKAIKQIFVKEGIVFDGRNITTSFENALKFYKGHSKEPSMEHSNKMAELSRKILFLIKPELSKADYRMVNYLLAEAVLRLETMNFSEYKSPEAELAVFQNPSTLHIHDFNRYAESYVDGSADYAQLPKQGGLLSWNDIRSLYANNSWIIGIAHHDMYHLHYAYGHPYYLAVNINASRSINDRRYFLISSLWESVDTFRTGLENSISKYVQSKGLSPQDGMLMLATATENELTNIESAMNEKVENNGQFSVLSYKMGWRPTKTAFGRNGENYNEKTFSAEIENYLNASLHNMSVKTNVKYSNYHRKGPGVVSEKDEDHVAGYGN